MDKMKCSGILCPMQHTYIVENCKITGSCPCYTPVDHNLVRVVRCKDCIYMKDGHCENEEMNQGMPPCWLSVEPEWYCCHGVRRSD